MSKINGMNISLDLFFNKEVTETEGMKVLKKIENALESLLEREFFNEVCFNGSKGRLLNNTNYRNIDYAIDNSNIGLGETREIRESLIMSSKCPSSFGLENIPEDFCIPVVNCRECWELLAIKTKEDK